MSFNFPYDTCEASNQDSFVKQPFSFGVGILTLLILSWFIYNAKTVQSKVLLGTLFAFEAFHAYSHMVHVQDFVQTRVIHGLAYFVNAALLWSLSSSTRHFPEVWIIALLIGIVALDIYAFLYMPLVAYISTQFLLFFVIIAYFLRWLPVTVKQWIPWLSVIMIFIVILEINEQVNCTSLMQWAPWFPWHIFIELAGLTAIIIIANMFSGIGLTRLMLWDRGLYR
jgi:hypothetical protein